ncbi:hypothetical protein H2202_010734 [Exophiala xenobiotica]|nr:hypothetical protein H2202_010734 [Exophiala xenobiotica]
MFQPKCVATTVKFRDGPNVDEKRLPRIHAESFYRSLQWPPDLLEEDKQPHGLSPYCTIPAKEPVNAIAAYPFFNLEDATTALVLSSLRDHPIRLNSALSGHLGASYPLVNPMTEAFISPHSLTFTPQGDRFIAGSDSLISVFDLSRPGQEPISSLPTGPKRKTTDYNPAVNMRGIVSALAMDNSTGVLAAGTYGRQVGLYNAMGQAECVGVFSVQGTAADTHIGGGGITQVTWSQDGRYLYITERKSHGVVIYDIRKTGQLLAWLEGRKAQTNQRLAIDLVTSNDQGGQEVWAGGLDGYVRVWRDPHQQEGSVSPAFEFKAHDDAISGVGIHNGGSVLATASGQRHFDATIEGEQSVDGVVDTSVKIWTL